MLAYGRNVAPREDIVEANGFSVRPRVRRHGIGTKLHEIRRYRTTGSTGW